MGGYFVIHKTQGFPQLKNTEEGYIVEREGYHGG
jgi:hypothetical protein